MAERPFDEGGDRSRRMSSPSEKPRPSVGTGGPERRDVRPSAPFGTSEAAFGESKGPLLTFGWEGVLLWSTLGREELMFIVHIL